MNNRTTQSLKKKNIKNFNTAGSQNTRCLLLHRTVAFQVLHNFNPDPESDLYVLGLMDLDLLVRGTAPPPDPSIIKQK
jgi:hypothetical protein